MTLKELQDALKLAVDNGCPLSVPVYIENIDGGLDEIRDVVSDQSSATILIKE